MRYLKRFNESVDGDIFSDEDIKDCFRDFLDDGFSIGLWNNDNNPLRYGLIGRSFTIKPKLWISSVHELSESDTFECIIVRFNPEYNQYNLSILDTLDDCIKRFESTYYCHLDFIYIDGIKSRGLYTSFYNYFNSVETIRDLINSKTLVIEDNLLSKIQTLELTFNISR